MNERELTVLTDVALITCIVQRGLADTMIEASRDWNDDQLRGTFRWLTGLRYDEWTTSQTKEKEVYKVIEVLKQHLKDRKLMNDIQLESVTTPGFRSKKNAQARRKRRFYGYED